MEAPAGEARWRVTIPAVQAWSLRVLVFGVETHTDGRITESSERPLAGVADVRRGRESAAVAQPPSRVA